MPENTVVPSLTSTSAIPRDFKVRGSGDLMQCEGKAAQLDNIADEVERDLAYVFNQLTAEKIAEVRGRIAMHRADAIEWRALAAWFRGA